MKFKNAARLARVAARLRDRGFLVQEYAGWESRGHSEFATIEHVTLHHTATGGTKDYASLELVTKGRADLAGPLCNWGVGRAGTIFLIAAGVAWHAGPTWETYQSNARSLGIEAENNGVGEPWLSPIWTAYVALVEELRIEFGIPRARVQGHRETCKPKGRKIDPANFDLDEFRRQTDPPLTDTSEDDLSAEDTARLINVERILTELLPSRAPGSKASIDLGTAVRDTNGDLFALKEHVVRPRTSLQNPANALAPLDYLPFIDGAAGRIEARLAGLEAAVATLAAALADDATDLSAAQILSTVRDAISTAVVKVDVAVTSQEH